VASNGAYYGFKYATGEISAPVFYYGWVNLTVGSGNLLTLNSAAIHTTPGASLMAGQTTTTAVPEPGAWVPSVLLVLAGALRRRRPRRAQVAGVS
jgi:MYXO-CTERM domain-containing protein